MAGAGLVSPRGYASRMRFWPAQERLLARLCNEGARARTNVCRGLCDPAKALDYLEELRKFGFVATYKAGAVTYWRATEKGRLRTGILRVGWDVAGGEPKRTRR